MADDRIISCMPCVQEKEEKYRKQILASAADLERIKRLARDRSAYDAVVARVHACHARHMM